MTGASGVEASVPAGGAGLVRQRLRSGTAAAHQRLEAALGLDQPLLTMPRYGAALRVLHAARIAWEPEIAALAPCAGGPHLAWLGADLTALGLLPLPRPPALQLSTPAHAWGARYVFEGSALGGQVLVRRLARLGADPDACGRYFSGYGAATGSRWTGFLLDLEQACGAVDPADVVAGASTVFQGLTDLAKRDPAGRSGQDGGQAAVHQHENRSRRTQAR